MAYSLVHVMSIRQAGTLQLYGRMTRIQRSRRTFEFTFIKNSTDQRFWILCVEIIHLTTGALQHWTGVIYFTFDNDTSVDTVKEAVKKEMVGRGKFLGYRLLYPEVEK